jgi:hypothetical protein
MDIDYNISRSQFKIRIPYETIEIEICFYCNIHIICLIVYVIPQRDIQHEVQKEVERRLAIGNQQTKQIADTCKTNNEDRVENDNNSKFQEPNINKTKFSNRYEKIQTREELESVTLSYKIMAIFIVIILVIMILISITSICFAFSSGFCTGCCLRSCIQH